MIPLQTVLFKYRQIKAMFQTGDIVKWSEDSTLWVVIEGYLPSETNYNVCMWKMRRKNDQGQLPKLMLASSRQLTLVCRPYFFTNQKLIFRQYNVIVIKDAGGRVRCGVISISECRPPRWWGLNSIVDREMEILRSALVESNISIFMLGCPMH
jgi:hypothetical protein